MAKEKILYVKSIIQYITMTAYCSVLQVNALFIEVIAASNASVNLRWMLLIRSLPDPQHGVAYHRLHHIWTELLSK